MKLRWFGPAALACSGALALSGIATAATTDDSVEIDLYNLTDIHGHIEPALKDGVVAEAGLVSMACEIENGRSKNPNSQFVLLGDNIGASPFTSGIAKDNPTIAALNAMTPLASTLGNHELDLGQQAFKDRVDGKAGFVKVGFPYLAASVEGLPDHLGSYKIWEAPAGVKIAFIGAIAQDVPNKVDKGTTDGMTFHDPVTIVNDLAKKLKAQGEADLVVAMIDDDAKNTYPKMGAAVDGLMGGDTHVWYGFDMVSGAENNVLSATASGAYTDNLSRLVLTVDPSTKKVTSSRIERITAAEAAKCEPQSDTAKQVVSQVKRIVDEAIANAQAERNRVVAEGFTGQFRRGVFQASADKQPAPGSNRGIESSLGNLVADSFKETVTNAGHHVDVGLIVAGAIRDELIAHEGKITYGDVFAVLPFSDKMAVNRISGANFKLALEQQWKEVSEQNSRPLLKLGLSSNVNYTYDPSKPYGERITSVMIDGEPLDSQREYSIASVKFLMDGGDGFTALVADGEPTVLPMDDKMPLDRDFAAKYIADHSQVQPRAAKSAIGVTLPDSAPDGSTVSIQLRGLSYSEGPSITKSVKVSLGSVETTAAVDNSLLEPNANTAQSIITTDGAGQASVEIKAAANCAEHAGKEVFLPLTVTTDFATVVSPHQGLGVSVQCPATEPPAPSVDPTAAPVPTVAPAPAPTASATPAPNHTESPAPTSGNKPAGKLPVTGLSVLWPTLAVMFLGLGGAAFVLRRASSRN